MAVGLVLAVLGGSLIEKFGMERYLEDLVKNTAGVDLEGPT